MSATIEKETLKQTTKPPSLWNVICLNDEYTPIDFVMEVIQVIFNKTPEEAYTVVMKIHQSEKGIIAQYPKDIAVTKQTKAIDYAKKHGHPLLFEIEPAE